MFRLWIAAVIMAQAAVALGNPMNPDLSVIGTFLGRWTDDVAAPHQVDGRVEEVELALKADVDPYFVAEAFVAGDAAVFGVEEAHLDTLALPAGLQASLGRIRGSFGKLNLTHEHAWYTVTPPLLATALFGGDALVDDGARLAWLIPVPGSTFHEVTIEALRGNDAVSFNGGTAGDWTGVTHARNFIDLSPATSVELGASAAVGPNGAGPGTRTRLYGADVTMKWRPPESNTRHALTFQAEGALSEREQPDAAGTPDTVRMPAGWVLVDVQPWQRWHVAGRLDGAAATTNAHAHARAVSGVVSFSPSEFSNLMTEVRSDRTGGSTWTTVFVKATFALGPHGAHAF